MKVTANVDTASSQAIVEKDRFYFMRIRGDKLVVTSPRVVVPLTGQKAVSRSTL